MHRDVARREREHRKQPTSQSTGMGAIGGIRRYQYAPLIDANNLQEIDYLRIIHLFSGYFPPVAASTLFLNPRNHSNYYIKELWNSLRALQSFDASTDPSSANEAMFCVVRCAFMLNKHDATGELPLDIWRILQNNISYSAEPKRDSFTPPHPRDMIDFAKLFDLGTATFTCFYIFVVRICF